MRLACDPATDSPYIHLTDSPATHSGEVSKGVMLDDDARFLGDLYQDLSEPVRKKYALLQTPEFVEEFILDRTLTPALGEVGYREVRLTDPTCGSGRFLLGAFRRLFDLWAANEPARNLPDLAQRALDVFGVYINPYAVAIARFRLTMAAIVAADIGRLADAPDFRVRIAVGDSLCHNKGSTVDQHGARQRTAPFEDFYAFNGTKVQEFPLVDPPPTDLARQLDTLGRELAECLPAAVLADAKTKTPGPSADSSVGSDDQG